MTGKEFDRLLKGRFFQALHVRWQRKLVAPKPEETFIGFYDRARMIEQHEKQYAASAAVQGDGAVGKKPDRVRKPGFIPPVIKLPEKTGNTPLQFSKERRFHRCKELGHFKRDCPLQTEAPGRSKGASTAAVGATRLTANVDELTVEELLAALKLKREQALLEVARGSTTNAI